MTTYGDSIEIGQELNRKFLARASLISAMSTNVTVRKTIIVIITINNFSNNSLINNRLNKIALGSDKQLLMVINITNLILFFLHSTMSKNLILTSHALIFFKISVHSCPVNSCACLKFLAIEKQLYY